MDASTCGLGEPGIELLSSSSQRATAVVEHKEGDTQGKDMVSLISMPCYTNGTFEYYTAFKPVDEPKLHKLYIYKVDH